MKYGEDDDEGEETRLSYYLFVALKKLEKKYFRVKFAGIQISVLFNHLCVFILFQNANSHLCFTFLSRLFIIVMVVSIYLFPLSCTKTV